MTNYDWNKYGYLLHCTHLKMIYFVFKIAFGYCLRIKKIWDNKNILDRIINETEIKLYLILVYKI
jgi:hypothetical protein